MQVPFLDLKIQYQSIKEEVNSSILGVIENTEFVLGKSVQNFEKEFAKKHNTNYCLGVSSGTDANHLALWALGVGPTDEVIIPANTFIATAWGATLCGAKPVFADINSESFNMDPAKIEAAITSKTKAINVVHLYGQAADIDPIRDIAKKHNLFLIEDCAQSHLAEYKGRKVGGLSDAASFSFYPGKNLGAYGEGGALMTNNEVLATKSKMIRDHGSLQKYHHEIYGHNYRMDGIQGAVLDTKLKYLENWTEGRRAVAAKYNSFLADISGISVPKEMDYAKHVYHLFVLQIKEGQEKRDMLARFLNDNAIATGLHYPVPLHLQKCFNHLGYKKGDFPITERSAECGISLPMYPELNDQQIEYVSEKIKAFFSKN